jgi:hypothetical protein
MEAKEKAKELIELFSDFVDYKDDDCINEIEKILVNAKHCARISVNEAIEVLEENSMYLGFHYYKVVEFYEKVLLEIDYYENES